MTIVIGPFGGGTAIGSTGSNTFQRHPAGNLVRQRVTPANPSTAAQVSIRAVWSGIMTHWRTGLTAEQREAWAQYATTFQVRGRRRYPHFITGRQAFIRANVIPRRIADPFIDNPPPLPGILQPHAFGVFSTSGAGIIITATFPTLTVDELLQVRLSFAHNFTRNYFRGPWRVSPVFEGIIGAPFLLQAPPLTNIGERYFLTFTVINRLNGQQTPTVTGVQDVLT